MSYLFCIAYLLEILIFSIFKCCLCSIFIFLKRIVIFNNDEKYLNIYEN